MALERLRVAEVSLSAKTLLNVRFGFILDERNIAMSLVWQAMGAALGKNLSNLFILFYRSCGYD